MLAAYLAGSSVSDRSQRLTRSTADGAPPDEEEPEASMGARGGEGGA